MDDFVVAFLAQELGDLPGMAALDAVEVPGRVVAQPHREGPAFRVQQLHRGALAEAAPDLDDARGQQALVLLNQGLPGPPVQPDGAFGGDVVGQPVLAALQFLRLGQEKVPTWSPAKSRGRMPGSQAVADEDGHPGGRRLFGGLELAAHAAPPQGPGPSGSGLLQLGVEDLHQGHQPGVGMFPGVLIEQAVGVGEQDEQIGPRQVADEVSDEARCLK